MQMRRASERATGVEELAFMRLARCARSLRRAIEPRAPPRCPSVCLSRCQSARNVPPPPAPTSSLVPFPFCRCLGARRGTRASWDVPSKLPRVRAVRVAGWMIYSRRLGSSYLSAAVGRRVSVSVERCYQRRYCRRHNHAAVHMHIDQRLSVCHVV